MATFPRASNFQTTSEVTYDLLLLAVAGERQPFDVHPYDAIL